MKVNETKLKKNIKQQTFKRKSENILKAAKSTILSTKKVIKSRTAHKCDYDCTLLKHSERNGLFYPVIISDIFVL